MVRASSKRMGGKNFHGKCLYPPGAKLTGRGVLASKKHSTIHVQTEPLCIFHTAGCTFQRGQGFIKCCRLFFCFWKAECSQLPAQKQRSHLCVPSPSSCPCSFFPLPCELPSAAQPGTAWPQMNARERLLHKTSSSIMDEQHQNSTAASGAFPVPRLQISPRGWKNSI